ncbi:hypothetical protein CANTEDRAFT_112767 [Yamadazyma tenuis ATCC 10573]|uniref:BZIP domain-containing protein n=2 Tax=Candida tenuis TaxID=2315449 RepID=G3AYN6_CANTC|nr:uncharacterized protein CANTEDRAFT_112767 [Yamadazyma tenuis ATCC 10573]EGV66224.1 hypothetical protein CANTEDRAFT_112767 [Yamadazyma tenuis ATCC 10573]
MDMDIKTTLPPRKRAKTEEEKEQRRIERILRNRRAAHQSREKKRKYVEYLEGYISRLTSNLDNYHHNQEFLLSKINSSGSDMSSIRSNLKKIDNLVEYQDFKFQPSSTVRRSSIGDYSADLDSNENGADASANNDDVSPDSYNNEEDSFPVPVEKSTQPADDSVVDSSDFSPDEADFNLLINPVDNYLSPVSIDSPANSPIDLSLIDLNYVHNSSNHLGLLDSDQSPMDLEHNSEVVVVTI